MSSSSQLNLDQIRLFLARHQALIVHCSGTPKGVGPGRLPYPADLKHVTQGLAQGGISCSLLKPGDRFHGAGRNSTGSVGLVVAPTSSSSLVAVAPDDIGSYVVEGVRLGIPEGDVGIGDLESSIVGRGDSYNEWIVRDFKVIGLFVAEPATTWQEVSLAMTSGHCVQQAKDISVPDITAEFPGLPVFTLSGDSILRWSENAWEPAAHSDIYPAIHEENYRPVNKQHVMPAASIRRFFREGTSYVEVFLRAQSKSVRQGESWREFVANRMWDEQIERAALVDESAFQNLADLIIAGKDTLTPQENLVASKFWAIISERSRARRVPLESDSVLERIPVSTLPNSHLDHLENQGMFLAGTIDQLNRAVYGLAQRTAVMAAERKPLSWRVVRANEGQFLVSDDYHRAQRLPVDPTTYLEVGDGALTLNRLGVIEFNKFLLERSERYVFARSLSDCGVGINTPQR
ncbi:MAG: hypothetical protein WBW32_14860 [Luteibacter sp.]